MAERGSERVASGFDGAASGAELAAGADGAAATLPFWPSGILALDAALTLGRKLVEPVLDVMRLEPVELLRAEAGDDVQAHHGLVIGEGCRLAVWPDHIGQPVVDVVSKSRRSRHRTAPASD